MIAITTITNIRININISILHIEIISIYLLPTHNWSLYYSWFYMTECLISIQ